MSYLLVFIGGGIVCAIAQILIDLTKLTPARILVLYVSVGVLLYAVGIFDPLKEIFGAGVTLPLIGFGANVADGVKKAVDSQGLYGVLTGPLTSSSAGISAALLSGFLASLIFDTKSKRM